MSRGSFELGLELAPALSQFFQLGVKTGSQIVRRIEHGVFGLVDPMSNGLQLLAKPCDIVLFGLGPLLLLLERFSQPGERYLYSFGVWDGYPSSHYTCSDCREIQRFLTGNLACFCWESGTLIEDAKEAISEAYSRARDEVQGVAFGFGRLLVKARRARAASVNLGKMVGVEA